VPIGAFVEEPIILQNCILILNGIVFALFVLGLGREGVTRAKEFFVSKFAKKPKQELVSESEKPLGAKTAEEGFVLVD
jgi:hypothetical protein